MSLVMSESLRHFVLTGKDPVSRDCEAGRAENVFMAKDQAKSAYKTDFIRRTKEARKARGYSQEELSELLGIDQPKYSKYETRSYLPHDLIPRFCLACGADPAWLFTGKGRMTMPPALPRESATKRAPRKRRKAA